jgi:hypothetical protein
MANAAHSVVSSGAVYDASADELTANVYEGDLHALIENQAAHGVSHGGLSSTAGMVDRLRDAVWPFLK